MKIQIIPIILSIQIFDLGILKRWKPKISNF